MKNKIIALLLTVLTIPAFAQTKVAQKQIDNLQDSLNVRQRYADTNTFDATRNWVLGQIAADTPTLNEVLAAGNVADNRSITLQRDDSRRVVLSSSIGLSFNRPVGLAGWNFYFGNLRSTGGDTILTINGVFGNTDAYQYTYLGGTAYNSTHVMRFNNNYMWFGAPSGTSNPSGATYRFGNSIGGTGNIQVDNLAGTGTRMVVASSTGVLSTNAMPVMTETDPVYTAALPGIFIYRGSISNVDLNTLNVPGLYYCSSANAPTLTNCPFPSGNLHIVVYASPGGSTVTQKVINLFEGGTYDNQIYTRTQQQSSATWSSWRRLISGGDDISLLTNDAGYITSYQNIANTNLTINTSRTLSIASGGELKFDGTGALTLYGSGGNPAGLKFESGSSGAGVLFGAKSFSYTADLRVNNLTANRILSWPDSSGTLALTSDIHGGIVDDGSGYGVSEDAYDGWNTQGGLITHLTIVDDDYTVTPGDYTIICRGADSWELELPDPTDWRGRILTLSMQMKNDGVVGVNLSEDVRYFDPADGIGTMTTSFLTGYGEVHKLQSNGTYWYWLNPTKP